MPCGTLAEIATSVVKAGDAVVQTQLVERATTPHVTAAMDQFGMAAQHLSGTADSLKGTADALTGTAQGATDTLAEGKRTIADAQPLLIQLTANGASLQRTTDTLNDTLKREAVGEMLDNLAGVTAHGNAIAGDFQQVADKARADFLRPVPWWQQPIRKSGQLIDIGAAIARHTP
jgi:ABC-type transporter Mla subunit MlaD